MNVHDVFGAFIERFHCTAHLDSGCSPVINQINVAITAMSCATLCRCYYLVNVESFVVTC